MRTLFFITVLFLLFVIDLSAQDFGDISKEELEMLPKKEYADADAVILFDKGTITIQTDFTLKITRHIRFKIFTEQGKQYTNIKIPYWHEDELGRLEAVSYSPDGEEYELDDDNIFEEEGTKFNKVSFSIPGVEKGSVVEYKYQLISEYIRDLEPWFFQSQIFTELSELAVSLPAGFSYNKLNINLENYNLEQKEEKFEDHFNNNKQYTKFTFVCRNLPGIKDEPFTDNIYDKYAKMFFELRSYENQFVHMDFSKTWDQAVKYFKDEYENCVEEDDNVLRNIQEIYKNSAGLEKAKQIYKYVCTEIKTTEHKALAGDKFKKPEAVAKDKAGSSSEKNMLLINLLNHAGFNSEVVLVSTKSHGAVIPNYIDIDQFNRIICRLTINNKPYFLDTGIKALPFGYLPSEKDIETGLLIKEEKSGLIKIEPLKMLNRTDIKTSADLGGDGMIKVTTQITRSGYEAITERTAVEESEANKRIEEFVKNIYSQAVVDTFYYTDADSINKPITLTIKYSMPDYLNETDQYVYLTLPLITSTKTNPFVKPTRYSSIDFPYPLITNEELKLNLPKNLNAVQLPESKRSGIDNLYVYNIGYSRGDNFILCQRRTNLYNRKIPGKNYPAIKTIYEEMAAGDQRQIVLTKTAENTTTNK